jgi:dCTP deaminase
VQTVKRGEPFILQPGQFVLAATLERVSLPGHIAGQLGGRSTLARLGLQVHSTAGWIDPGFTGNITLELSSLVPCPLKLWPGDTIAQLSLFRVPHPGAARPYGTLHVGRYQGQVGPTSARPAAVLPA